MTVLAAILALYAVAGSLVAWIYATAPEGFEDDEGWHAGREPSRRGEPFGSHRSASPAASHSERAL